MNKSSGMPHMITVLAGVLSFLIGACCPLKPLSPPAALKTGNLDRPTVFDHSHSKFDLILKRYVINGLVDYRGILEEPDLFYEYIGSLAEVELHTLDKWTREQQLAFWINAYNALTIQVVMERYPIECRSLIGLFFPKNSILQIPGVWTRLKFNVGGRLLSLGQIEHDIIRRKFGDARAHFAIVCASRSCPALRSEAYQADVLEFQLEEQAFQFVNDPVRGLCWDTANRRLYISKIFKWFRTDFKKASLPTGLLVKSRLSGNHLPAFIQQYLKSQNVKDALADGKQIRVSYLPYDWRLNDLAETQPESTESSAHDG